MAPRDADRWPGDVLADRVSWRPPLKCPTEWTCGPDFCAGGCGGDPPVIERQAECLLCGEEWCPQYGQSKQPVLLVGDGRHVIQELPSFYCRDGRGADVVALDGWCVVVDHATEAFLVKMQNGAAVAPFYTRSWYDMARSAMVAIIQPQERLRGVRLWFTDLWRVEHSMLLVPAR